MLAVKMRKNRLHYIWLQTMEEQSKKGKMILPLYVHFCWPSNIVSDLKITDNFTSNNKRSQDVGNLE